MNKMTTNFSLILSKIFKELGRELPGLKSHLKMTPYQRKSAKEAIDSDLNPKMASVLLLIYQKEEETYFSLIKRVDYDGQHGGQISFPGGKNENGETMKETALRETEEEIGLKKESITILGELSQVYIPPSNFLITPFIGYIDYTPSFKVQEREVDYILEIPLKQLMNDDNVKIKKIPLTKYAKTNMQMEAPYFELNKHIVWGATAVVLSEFKDLMNR